MARHNEVYFYAQVTRRPIIKLDERGDFLKGQVLLTVSRGNRNAAETDYTDYEFDCPVLLSKNKEVIAEMANWEINDIVFVKGVLSTRDLDKKSTCSHCGYENMHPGTVGYVVPIHAIKIKKCDSVEDAIEDLKQNSEISNNCKIIGNVCDKLRFHKNENGIAVAQYNLAINRKFRIKEDPATITVDYPRVKAYGENAENDAMFIQVGSTVLIDGYLQTRQFKKKVVCQNCSEVYEADDRAIEIVPYATEYLQGCRTLEDIEEMKQDSESSFETIFDLNTEE